MTNKPRDPIYVTKSFLPPLEEYEQYLKEIWSSHYLTNEGPLVKKFENELEQLFNVKHVQFTSNGTIALQMALRVFDISEGEVITTPFTYVATTSSIMWERCDPVFVDIDPESFCIDPEKIELAITEETKAIMPVHVFGNPCDIDAIKKIADKHKLPVIYDAAHSFGVNYKERSIFEYGDISMGSFHATKPFHTIEGGCVAMNDSELDKKYSLMKKFGHDSFGYYSLGINGKNSEFNAAMGLTNLKYVSEIIHKRRELTKYYDSLIDKSFQKQKIREGTEYNYPYYVILFRTEKLLLDAIEDLNMAKIFPRRYFHPSLNQLPYIEKDLGCPISEDISSRVLSLPLSTYLTKEDIEEITSIVNHFV